MKIGFIGIGSLGSPIAQNLLQRGHELFVYNRTLSKTTSLVAAGASACRTIQELGKSADIVFSIVSDDAALTEVATALMDSLNPRAVHISMSTVLAATADELSSSHAQNEQCYIAAPVFGRPEAAAVRKLNFVIAGDSDVKERIKPLLTDAGAAGIFDFGTIPGHANTVKLSGNFLIAAAMEAIGESIGLAGASGIDPTAMWAMFSQTLFNNPIYQNYSRIILEKQFAPAAFTAKLGLKDMRLVLAQATTVNQTMPLANLLKTNLQQLVDDGKPDMDWSAVSLGGNSA